MQLSAYCDGDWAGDSDTIDHHSIRAYVVHFGCNPISWTSWKQHSVARSSTEVEYQTIASTTAEVQRLQNLLHDLSFKLQASMIQSTP